MRLPGRLRLENTSRRRLAPLLALTLLLAWSASSATASPRKPSNWAASAITAVTRLGLIASSPATFDPQAPLTEKELAAAVTAIGKLQNRQPAPVAPLEPLHVVRPATVPPAETAPAAPAAPAQVLSTIPDGATIAGVATWAITMPTGTIRSVTFKIDGIRQDVESSAPFVFARAHGELVTSRIRNGSHRFAAAVRLVDGSTYVAVWTAKVANTPGAAITPLSSDPQPVPITHVVSRVATVRHSPIAFTTTPVPVQAPIPTTAVPPVYRALSPSQPVTIKELDAALVDYLDLAPAAREIQATLAAAGLNPPPGTGTEAVARMLGLRFDHPAGHDDLELLPNEDATRAEAAYSFARLLALDPSAGEWAQSVADGFTLPALSTWQKTVLTTAVQYVGYPYVWGGVSPTAEAPFGNPAPGGFDCSGFVWRVFKLTAYPGEKNLADVIRGRTTYVMSGEVPASKRIPARKLEPGDVMFFGVGPHSKPSQIGHTGIYLGNGWFIQSSGQGVTLRPFSDWYARSFAWARRPLREAGLA